MIRRLVDWPRTARRLTWLGASAVLLASCGHTDAFSAPDAALGARGAGPDVQLTFNPEQDYWPAWTEDGRGILYSFISPGVAPQHRCVGLLPAAGGTQLWRLCDNRFIQNDSVNSVTAYALGADGRLLYAEATAQRGAQSTTPSETTLWLADSAAPFQRHALLTLPTFVGATAISWLADIAWTGPTSFLALGQNFTVLGHCMFCAALDSIFYGVGVVSGTVVNGSATLQLVTGTDGATAYSRAENGTSIVFTRRGDPHLFKVPVTGGAALATASVGNGEELLGVSCKGTTCVVADDPVTLSAVNSGNPPITFPAINPGVYALWGVSLTTGQVQLLRTAAGIVATPVISPVTGDVVAQVGGGFGHLQSFTASGSDLHLYQGLVP